MANTKSRNYLLTINNPQESGYTHDFINQCMSSFNWVYYCMCDEIGLESKTYHTHLFLYVKNPIYFNSVKKVFETAHIDKCFGSSQNNRDYIRKEGKWLESNKKETNLIETFEEYGNIPQDICAKNNKVSEQVLNRIEDGASDSEILREFPSYINKLQYVDRAREEILFDKFKHEFRKLYVAYIWGSSRVGKTSFVMNSYGYDNVYRVSNYKNPFDNYKGQDVLLLDEFNSQLSLETMLQVLDGYPFQLPSRYYDKIACYTKVFVISNISLGCQYLGCEVEQWHAFLNRFDSIVEFGSNGLDNAMGYLKRDFFNREVF